MECLGGLTFSAFVEIITSNPVENESVSDIRKVFRKYDRENKGYISRRDVEEVMRQVHENYSEEELDRMFGVMDLEKNGKVSFDSFVKVMHNPHAF